MACKNVAKLCDKIVISQNVTFAGGNLVINLPEGDYNDGCKYCIIVAQPRPAATTVNAPVVITVGTGTQQYPLADRCCRPVSACMIGPRMKYSICVETTGTSAVFRLLGDAHCIPSVRLRAVNGTAPVADAPTA